MSHPLSLPRIDLPVRQWRLAAIVLTAVAAVELILLIAVGGALLTRSDGGATVAAKRPLLVKAAKAKPATTASTTAAALPRRKTGVLVLNGNGRTGAASVAANRVTQRGYRVRGVANAPNAGYARSIVMYRPGFRSEGARLARDLGVPIVGPLDGMRPSQLNGAHAVLILGA